MNILSLTTSLKFILIIALIQLFFINAVAQKIVYKSDSVKNCIEKEKELKSVNTTLVDEDSSEGDVIIFNKNDYPFSTSLGSPIEFVRTICDFHIMPSVNYYFTQQDSVLKYVEMKWDANNSLDIFSAYYLQDMEQSLKEECAKKGLYKKFYNRINKKIISLFGQPTKRIKTKKWESSNAEGWRYEWKYDSYIIVTELRLPKEETVGFIYITYSIGWR